MAAIKVRWTMMSFTFSAILGKGRRRRAREISIETEPQVSNGWILLLLAFAWKISPEAWLQHILIEVQQSAAHCNICQRDSLTNQEGARKEVRVECLQGLLHVLLCSLSRRLVELHYTEGWEDPGARGGQDLAVCKAKPLLDLRLLQVTVTSQLLVWYWRT